jgi:hypothetical protein
MTKRSPSINVSDAQKNSPSLSTFPSCPKSIELGIVKDFLDVYEPTTECPRAFLWSSFITCFGSVISPFVRRNHAFAAQPRLYVVNVGQSGVSRKSTGSALATQLFREIGGQ